jgi:cation-transporting ATPase 13A3/4/5
MSVVCRLFEEQSDGFTEPLCCIYCKGSPEKIGRLCRPDSLPADFHTMLEGYARHGYRILALATKRIPVNLAKTARINRLARAEIEAGLDLLGLIILENRLKPASSAVLRELHEAQMRPVMVTGDNILTAVCVAQDCGLVPAGEAILQVQAVPADDTGLRPSIELSLLRAAGSGAADTTKAMSAGTATTTNSSFVIDMETASALDYHYATDGPSFEIICTHYREEVLPLLLARGTVFARMKPDMKQHLVSLLQGLGHYVAMCGDGANDCGALKAAHVGISLSEAEASVASPFTSRQADIGCVPLLVKEGRAALVTSFSIFKYMAGYSITQFVSVMILYEVYSNLSDMQYLYIDLFVITSLASVLGVNRTYGGRLSPRPPLNSLIAALPLFSLLSQLAIVIVFQFCCLYYTRRQPWFVPFDYENSCYNGTAAADDFEEQGLISLNDCDKTKNPVASYENYAMFSVSQFQYIILAMVFAKGAPFRESSFKNIPLVATVVILTAFSLYLVIHPHAPFVYLPIIGFELFLPPDEYMGFRFILLAMVAANTALAFLCEHFLADGLVQQLFSNGLKPVDKVAKQLLSNGNGGWPLKSLRTQSATMDTGMRVAPEPTRQRDVQIVEKNVDTPSKAFEILFAGVAHASSPVGSRQHAGHQAADSTGQPGSPQLAARSSPSPLPPTASLPPTSTTWSSTPGQVRAAPTADLLVDSPMATWEAHEPTAPPSVHDVPLPKLLPLPATMESNLEVAIGFPSYPTKSILATEPEITKEISKI